MPHAWTASFALRCRAAVRAQKLLNPPSEQGDVCLNILGARGSRAGVGGWGAQLHAAVVELYAAKGAEIKYSTVQNWYAGDENGKGGIYNFVTKRGLCDGDDSKISWTQVSDEETKLVFVLCVFSNSEKMLVPTHPLDRRQKGMGRASPRQLPHRLTSLCVWQVETGSAITWKYPSVILKGDRSVGEFYSVALTNNKQQADTGTKVVPCAASRPPANHTQSALTPGVQTAAKDLVPRGSRGRAFADKHAVGS